MVKENSGIVIDVKRMDEQLERHLDRLWRMQKSESHKQKDRISAKEDWEIDLDKLITDEAVIARGTFTSVHRGVYDGKDVAVKVLHFGEEGQYASANIASLRNAFMQEVSVWNKLDHPNVTKLIGATKGTSQLNLKTDQGELQLPSSVCLIVAEYIPGGTLKSYLIKNRLRKLPLCDVIKLALDLARGLSYLHAQKIIHRDVKTENVLLDNNRTAKITDFWVARIEASNSGEMTGHTGTLGYMAPEVFTSNQYDRKCDVYSFGICLWEMYCCDMPYYDLSPLEQTSAVVYQNLRPVIPKCCPKSLANVIRRCWDKDPNKRPEMKEVVHLLEGIDTSKGGGMIPRDQPRGCLCFFRHRGR